MYCVGFPKLYNIKWGQVYARKFCWFVELPPEMITSCFKYVLTLILLDIFVRKCILCKTDYMMQKRDIEEEIHLHVCVYVHSFVNDDKKMPSAIFICKVILGMVIVCR